VVCFGLSQYVCFNSSQVTLGWSKCILPPSSHISREIQNETDFWKLSLYLIIIIITKVGQTFIKNKYPENKLDIEYN